VGSPADAGESVRADWLPFNKVLEMVRNGDILGSGSLVGLLYLLAPEAKVVSSGVTA